jgi:hypothetical protein
MLGDRAGLTPECHGPGQSELGGHGAGEVLRLIEASLPTPRGMHGHGHKDLAATAGPSPATSHRAAQHGGQPAFAAVLEGVQCITDRATERGAPLELEDALREWREEPQGHAGRLVEPAVERAGASVAQGLALATAPDAHGRQQQVEHTTHGTTV